MKAWAILLTFRSTTKWVNHKSQALQALSWRPGLPWALQEIKARDSIPISLLVKARAILLTFWSTTKWVTQVSALQEIKAGDTYLFLYSWRPGLSCWHSEAPQSGWPKSRALQEIKARDSLPISLLVKARAILLTFWSTTKWVTQVSGLARNKGQG